MPRSKSKHNIPIRFEVMQKFFDINEAFLEQLYKWQIDNPEEAKYYSTASREELLLQLISNEISMKLYQEEMQQYDNIINTFARKNTDDPICHESVLEIERRIVENEKSAKNLLQARKKAAEEKRKSKETQTPVILDLIARGLNDSQVASMSATQQADYFANMLKHAQLYATKTKKPYTPGSVKKFIQKAKKRLREK